MSEENKLPDQPLFPDDAPAENLVDQYLKLLESAAQANHKESTHYKLLHNLLAIGANEAIYPNYDKVAAQLTIEHAHNFQSATPEQLEKGARILVTSLNSVYQTLFDGFSREVANHVFITLRGL